MAKELTERGLLSDDQQGWLLTGDVPLVSSKTPIGEGALASSTNTGLNMKGLKVGRSLLVRLSDGSVLKVKGAGWANRGLEEDQKVAQLMPRHLPFAPIDIKTNSWQLFFGQTLSFAQAELVKGMRVEACLTRCAPNLLKSAVRPVQVHAVYAIPLPNGQLVPYVEALADPYFYTGQEEQAKYASVMALIRGRFSPDMQVSLNGLSLAEKRALLQRPPAGVPGVTPDYPRLVAKGLGDRYSEAEYLDNLIYSAAYLGHGGVPAVSIEHEPSAFRNSKLDWVLHPHEGLAVEGKLSPSLSEQAGRALRDIGELYRLSGVVMPAVTPSLATDPRGHLDGAALCREVNVASKGRAGQVLEIEMRKLAAGLAALLAGGVSFVDHHLMRKDFIGGVVTDYSDLRIGGAEVADLGMVLVQGRSQLEAMGKVLGLSAALIDDFKARFRGALLDRLRSSIRTMAVDPPPTIDHHTLGSQLQRWALAIHDEATQPDAPESTPHNQRLHNDYEREGRLLLLELGPLFEEAPIVSLRQAASMPNPVPC